MMIITMIIITMKTTIVLLLHLLLNMASNAVFSLVVVPLNKCTFLTTSMVDFGGIPPSQTRQQQFFEQNTFYQAN